MHAREAAENNVSGRERARRGKTSRQNEKRLAPQTGVPLVGNEVTSSWLIDEAERALREANLAGAERLLREANLARAERVLREANLARAEETPH